MASAATFVPALICLLAYYVAAAGGRGLSPFERNASYGVANALLLALLLVHSMQWWGALLLSVAGAHVVSWLSQGGLGEASLIIFICNGGVTICVAGALRLAFGAFDSIDRLCGRAKSLSHLERAGCCALVVVTGLGISYSRKLGPMGFSAASLLAFATITPAVVTWYAMTRRLHALSARLARTHAELTRIKAQLRARTERHKLSLRAIDDVIFYWNVRSNVLRWSANGARCRGWAPRSCKPWPLLKRSLHERDRERVLRDLRSFMDRNEAVWRTEFTLKGPDGALTPVSVRGILERDAMGKPWRMIGAITDMTDARVAKESARALARSARLATVGEITASITHEVNQPLAAILNNAETGLLLLQKKRASPEMLHAVLDDIRGDALRASEIVRRTRTLLQDREMTRERVNVNKLVTEAVDLLWLQAHRRGVTLSASPGSIPLVHADPVHLQQVLINLIANALEATEPSVAGDRRVEVSTAHHSAKVLVRVTDTGCGIAPAQLETIFESFNTSKAEGLGIGLSIARSIVKAHGGRIFAENNKFGSGATVSFELPTAVEATTHIRSPETQRGKH